MKNLRAKYRLKTGQNAPEWADEYWLETMVRADSLPAYSCCFTPSESSWNGLCGSVDDNRYCRIINSRCPHGAREAL